MAKKSNARQSKLKNQTTRAKAPTQRRRGQAAVTKALKPQGNVVAEARSTAHNVGIPANPDRNIVILGPAEGSHVMGLASSESLPRITSMFGQFYEFSRVRMALAQISAQKLLSSFAALMGCRSPHEFFQLQNQLVKEQLELFAASINSPFSIRPGSAQTE